MKPAHKLIAVADCRRQAFLYEKQAKAEPFAGMQTALLSVSRDWLEIADKIDRLAIVREINSVPVPATPNVKREIVRGAVVSRRSPIVELLSAAIPNLRSAVEIVRFRLCRIMVCRRAGVDL